MGKGVKLQVGVEEVCVVKPSKPTSVPHSLYLNGVDRLMKYSKPIRTILFYPSSSSQHNDVDVASAFAALRRGLADVLVPYYPFAGRLALDEDSGYPVIHCNDTGVDLTLSRCGLPFTELASHNYLPRPLFSQLVPLDHLSRSDHVDAPIASVQLTAFPDGLTVGIAVQHTVADGFCTWMFIKALGEACRGQLISITPVHARALLKLDTIMLNKFPPQHNPSMEAELITCPPCPQPPMLQVVIHFTKEKIDVLKKECATSTPSSHYSFSSYHALCAYLWKRYVMAKGLGSGEPVQCLNFLDIRSRTLPPLTVGYCGNAISGKFTSSKAGDIAEESLGATADRIRKTIQEVDFYSIKKFIEKMENPKLSGMVVNVFLVRNATHFPVFEASNFGWGEAVVTRPPLSDVEGEMTWYPCKQSGGLDVVFALAETTCAKFFSPEVYPNDPLDFSQLDKHVEAV